VILVTLPLKIESLANLREHWRKRSKRAKEHRLMAWACLREADSAPRLLGPVVVTLTRIAPRELDDDNLAGGFKSVRDGVADYFGVDDRSPLIRWAYAQRKGAVKEYGAEVRVEACEPTICMEVMA
jgi:hypothetical protein